MGQLANTVGRLESQVSVKLHSQTINPKENVNPVTLRSGKMLEKVPRKMKELVEESKKEKDSSREKEETTTSTSGSKANVKNSFPIIVPPPPFPSRFAKSMRDEHEKEILETFRKVQVNIPLLDAIYQVPRYAKFLKKLCTSKRQQKLKGSETVNVGKNVLEIIQRKLPTKCKDPGMFTIPCTIGNVRFEKAMLDSGASINIMSYSIYAYLKLGPLNETGINPTI